MSTYGQLYVVYRPRYGTISHKIMIYPVFKPRRWSRFLLTRSSASLSAIAECYDTACKIRTTNHNSKCKWESNGWTNSWIVFNSFGSLVNRGAWGRQGAVSIKNYGPLWPTNEVHYKVYFAINAYY